MESLYQERIETMINSTLKEILIYSFTAFILANLLEYTMPSYDESKDTPSLLLEIFVQITITVCIFMLLELKFPARYGLFTFVIVSVTTQSTFVKKINLMSEKIFNIEFKEKNNESYSNCKEHEEEEEEKDEETIEKYEEDNGCTSLNKLPSF